MSTEAPTPTTSATPERVFVQIPKAGPGQGYQAPKNYSHPLLQMLSKIAIFLLCLSLPIASGGIIVMILILDQTARDTQLWLWIPLGILIEAFAIFVAIGVGNEANGMSGANMYTR
ncbi:MAG TPA: hypothetical protein VKQ30_08880 [Ktedonobacterales bacterium]|nr:hypothetical protein [Ktedonobacterales bacterium]